jgi:hypothetical protein
MRFPDNACVGAAGSALANKKAPERKGRSATSAICRFILRSDRKADNAGLLKPPIGDILLLAYKDEAANCGGAYLLSWFAMTGSKDWSTN